MNIFQKTKGDFDVLNGAHGKLFEGLESLLQDSCSTKGSNFASAFYSCTLIEGLVYYLNEKLIANFDVVKEKYSRLLFAKGDGLDFGCVACIPKDWNKPTIAIPVDVRNVVKTYEKVETQKWKAKITSSGQHSNFGNSALPVVGPDEHQMVFALLQRNCLVKLSSFLDVDNPNNPYELLRFWNNCPTDQKKQIWIYEKGKYNGDLVYGECFPEGQQCQIQADFKLIEEFVRKQINTWDAVAAMYRLFCHHPKRNAADDLSKVYDNRDDRNRYCHNHILSVTHPKKRYNRWNDHGDLSLLIEFVKSLD